MREAKFGAREREKNEVEKEGEAMKKDEFEAEEREEGAAAKNDIAKENIFEMEED